MNTNHVFREVNAGRMTVSQGTEQLELERRLRRSRERFEAWVSLVLALLVCALLMFAFRSWGAEPAPVPAEVAPGFLEQLWRQLVPHLVEAVVGLFGLVVTLVLLPALKRWLTAKADTSVLAKVGLKIETLAESAIASAWPVIQKDLKDAAADGVITAEEVRKTVDDGLAALKGFLGTQGMSEVGGALGLGGELLQQYLRGLVEAKVQAAVAAGQVGAAKVVDGQTAANAING